MMVKMMMISKVIMILKTKIVTMMIIIPTAFIVSLLKTDNDTNHIYNKYT